MADSLFVSESTLTDRYQTTVPDPVRKALGLNKRDKIRYTIQQDGNVILSRADLNQDDPVLDAFLQFIADDIQKNPQNIKAVSAELVERVQDLVGDINADLDDPLSDEDD
ncbi:regulator PrlF [Oleiphilus messinensis]|uniref:Regulator PrlF n=1 Tax=Oleiphilus messinensis TaxID=141451 RepID=A0A1Y0IG19_9GAMM|nr:type II toxin-antitoxin system PrlF family antitoxin [Oleiphilus messinensis]ARU59079.1 regulator PrlF [Oleiphilus messinensis]